MPNAAHPGGAERHLARPLTRQGHEFRQAAHRQALLDDDGERGAADQPDGGEIAQRIIARIGLDGGVHRHRPIAADHDVVAIGPHARHLRGGHAATGTRAVLHHHRLAQHFTEGHGQNARHHIGIAAGGIGHHEADGPLRKGGGAAEARGGKQRRQQQQGAAARNGHGVHPFYRGAALSAGPNAAAPVGVAPRHRAAPRGRCSASWRRPRNSHSPQSDRPRPVRRSVA